MGPPAWRGLRSWSFGQTSRFAVLSAVACLIVADRLNGGREDLDARSVDSIPCFKSLAMTPRGSDGKSLTESFRRTFRIGDVAPARHTPLRAALGRHPDGVWTCPLNTACERTVFTSGVVTGQGNDDAVGWETAHLSCRWRFGCQMKNT